MEELIQEIKENEGFSDIAYKDTLGFDTIGYGTKLPLSKDEATLILRHRLKLKIKELEDREPYFNKLPLDVQSILSEMAYQLGVSGLLKFKKMWIALKNSDFKEAAKEGLDSRWAKQTPNRANKLMSKLSSIAESI